MMDKHQKIDLLEQNLAEVHRKCHLPSPNANWNHRVMHAIRRESVVRLDMDALASPLVWRFAAVSCSLAIILSFYLFTSIGDQDQMAMDLFMGDPIFGQTLQLLSMSTGIAL